MTTAEHRARDAATTDAVDTARSADSTRALENAADSDTVDQGGTAGALAPVTRAWRRLQSAVLRLWRGVRRLWRTSLQFRVVLTTMLIGTVVTIILQSFLYERIADALVSARMATAQQEAANGARDMRLKLDSTDQTDLMRIQQVAADTMRQQENQSSDQTRTLILTRAINNQHGVANWTTIYANVPLTVIPQELRQAIADDPNHQQVQIVPVPGENGREVPAVVVGTQVQIPEAGAYELYYIFPMQREEDVMSRVWRVFVVGSVALVAALGLIAFVVTRIVVDPLRQASEVAGRLSDGHLNERMLVRGEDDIARLATAFNDMAEHLQQQIRQLEDLSRVQQRFVSDVSHELRTPLTTIHMASELIHDQRDSFDPVVARSTELLHAQVERFEELLADLLEISRFDAGGAALELEATDLRIVVARVVAGAEQLAEARGSDIVVAGDENPHVVAVDGRRVERILRNLVVNAVEHGEGRPVTIELASDQDAAAVVVADEGIGLAPGQAALVFNRFWRADPSRKRTTGGTGLGLAISLEDAHLHHGRLEAWGEPGRGSRFRLTLPRVAGSTPEGSPLPLEPPHALPAAESPDASTESIGSGIGIRSGGGDEGGDTDSTRSPSDPAASSPAPGDLEARPAGRAPGPGTSRGASS
ncbi:MtrAB system histidine kinase MtrB [Mobilicoccus massiliensis]|uniref:MtrAB system histidine kinase MtrB n=1 Tax=Mobilicoccus massiliensis TaxID=1522310 RepID=UPI0009E43DFE|nr:MtrAB system histidine kinase MtrB [Mobilicoccus massiliensis]